MISTKVKAIAGIVVILLIAWAGIATRKAYDYNLEANRLVDAIRVAAKNPKLARGDAAEQVQTLGQSLREAQDKLDQCGASVQALRAASASQQSEAAARLAQAADVADQALTTARVLERSARQPSAGTCLSDEVKRRWK